MREPSLLRSGSVESTRGRQSCRTEPLYPGPMTGRPLSSDERMRQLRIMAMAFYGVIIAMFVVLLVLSAGWDTPDDDLATVGAWVSAVGGLMGLGAAVWWRNMALARPIGLPRLFNTFLIVVAVAEVGMLLGLVLSFGAQSLLPFAPGALAFAIALTLMTSAFGQIEVADPT